MLIDDNIEAKKILDFLAKKIGYEEVVWTAARCIVLTRHDNHIPTAGRSSEDINHSSLYVSSLYVCRGLLLNSVVGNCKNHTELLDNLLKLSSTGWEIQTQDGLVFFPAETPLEKILLEMDLEGRKRKEIEKESDDARQ